MSVKVIFIVPQSFLRTKENTDPFYDPIIRILKEQTDFEWRVYLWNKGIECGYDKEKTGDYHILESCGVWFYRVFRLLAWKMPTWKIYRLFGVFARPFFAKRFSADLIMTQAGQFADVFATMLPGRRIVDLQHGIIYSWHAGYFDTEGRLLACYRNLMTREFWLFGHGFADCFFKHPDNAKDLEGRIKVIGDMLRLGNTIGSTCRNDDGVKCKRRIIVVSSQLTSDFPPPVLIAMKKIYEKSFEAASRFGTIIFRHHPRFGNCINLDDWKVRYPWVIVDTTSSWEDILRESICLMTINSTSAFDAAFHGVPTIILDGTSAGHRNILVDEYNYPYHDLDVERLCSVDYNNRSEIEEGVRKWFDGFYAPFSSQNCLSLIEGGS